MIISTPVGAALKWPPELQMRNLLLAAPRRRRPTSRRLIGANQNHFGRLSGPNNNGAGDFMGPRINREPESIGANK